MATVEPLSPSTFNHEPSALAVVQSLFKVIVLSFTVKLVVLTSVFVPLTSKSQSITTLSLNSLFPVIFWSIFPVVLT